MRSTPLLNVRYKTMRKYIAAITATSLLLATIYLLAQWNLEILVLVSIAFTALFISYLYGNPTNENNTLAEKATTNYEAVFEHINDIIIVYNTTHKQCEYVSASIEKILDYIPNEFRSLETCQLVHPKDLEQLKLTLDTHRLLSEPKFIIPIRIKHRNGQYLMMEVNGQASFKNRNRIDKVIMSIRDISNRAVTSQLTKEYLTDMQTQSSAELNLSQIISSHDLKEPLRTISNYIKILKERYADQLDENGKEFVHFISNGADRMKHMLEGVRSLVNVDQSYQSEELVDLNSILDKTKMLLGQRLEETNGTILNNALPTIKGDKQQLTHVFQNLIDNALKYNNSKMPIVQITIDPSDQDWVIRFRDNGIGIDTDFKDEIFELFRRLHNIEQYKGTGVGLAICKRVIDNHKGKIWVESDGLNKGSTFCVSIPKSVEAMNFGYNNKTDFNKKSVLKNIPNTFSRGVAIF